MKFVRSVAIYTFSNVFKNILPFALLPLLTMHLSKADYGITNLLIQTASILAPLSTLGAKFANKKNFFKESPQSASSYFVASLYIPLLTVPLIALLLYIAAPLIESRFHYPSQWLWAIPVYVLLRAFTQLTSTYYQFLQKPAFYAILQNLSSALELSLAVFFVAFCHWQLAGRMYSLLYSSAFIVVLGFLLLYGQGYLAFFYDKKLSLQIVRNGIPILPLLFSRSLFTAADVFLVSYWLGEDALGSYALAFRIASVAYILHSGVNLAWQPAVFKHLAKQDAGNIDMDKQKSKIVRKLLYSWLFFLMSSLGVALIFSPLAFAWIVDPKFADAAHLVLPLSLAIALFSITENVSIFLVAHEKNAQNTRTLGIALSTLCVLACIVLPKYGLQSMPYVLLTSHALLFVVQLWLVQKEHKLPFFDTFR